LYKNKQCILLSNERMKLYSQFITWYFCVNFALYEKIFNILLFLIINKVILIFLLNKRGKIRETTSKITIDLVIITKKQKYLQYIKHSNHIYILDCEKIIKEKRYSSLTINLLRNYQNKKAIWRTIL